jgi:hypothetical protein
MRQRLQLRLLDQRGQGQTYRTRILMLVLLSRFNLNAGTYTSVSRLAAIMTTNSERLEVISSVATETSSPSCALSIWKSGVGGETHSHGGDTTTASSTA